MKALDLILKLEGVIEDNLLNPDEVLITIVNYPNVSTLSSNGIWIGDQIQLSNTQGGRLNTAQMLIDVLVMNKSKQVTIQDHSNIKLDVRYNKFNDSISIQSRQTI